MLVLELWTQPTETGKKNIKRVGIVECARNPNSAKEKRFSGACWPAKSSVSDEFEVTWGLVSKKRVGGAWQTMSKVVLWPPYTTMHTLPSAHPTITVMKKQQQIIHREEAFVTQPTQLQKDLWFAGVSKLPLSIKS